MFCDEEVADDDADEQSEYLHEGDVEVADHVEFGEGVLGSDPHIPHDAAGLAEGLRVHDGAHIAVLAQTFTETLVAQAEDAVAGLRLLLALVEQDVEGLGDVGEYPSEDDGSHVSEGETHAGEEVVPDFAVPARQFLLVEVPVDGDGLEEEVGVGLQVAVRPDDFNQHKEGEDPLVDDLLAVLLQFGDLKEAQVHVEGGDGDCGHEDGDEDHVDVLPEADLGEAQGSHDELDALLLGADHAERDDKAHQESHADHQRNY